MKDDANVGMSAGVCKEEKAKRDECMLLNEDGEKACQPIIQEYKKCMKGFGFDL